MRKNIVSLMVLVIAKLTNVESRTCEAITVPMCEGIGYNYTYMPNELYDESQEEAGNEAQQFWPLVQIECSPVLRMFLCSVYTPICLENYSYIPACRSVCEQARAGCEPIMRRFGFKWPKHLECSKLPNYGEKDTICMDPSKTGSTTTTTTLEYHSNTTSSQGTTRKLQETTENQTTKPDTNTISTTKGESRTCERITVPMCEGVGYNYTYMPNELDHESQEEAEIEVHQFWPLVQIECSPVLRMFLCSVYTPKCLENYSYIPACRSVCEQARNDCEPIMRRFGFEWPKHLECSKLTYYGEKDTICMHPSKTGSATTTSSTTDP